MKQEQETDTFSWDELIESAKWLASINIIKPGEDDE